MKKAMLPSAVMIASLALGCGENISENRNPVETTTQVYLTSKKIKEAAKECFKKYARKDLDCSIDNQPTVCGLIDEDVLPGDNPTLYYQFAMAQVIGVKCQTGVSDSQCLAATCNTYKQYFERPEVDCSGLTLSEEAIASDIEKCSTLAVESRRFILE